MELFQLIYFPVKYDIEKHIWFKEDVIVIGAKLTTMFGFDVDHRMYIYELEFSLN